MSLDKREVRHLTDLAERGSPSSVAFLKEIANLSQDLREEALEGVVDTNIHDLLVGKRVSKVWINPISTDRAVIAAECGRGQKLKDELYGLPFQRVREVLHAIVAENAKQLKSQENVPEIKLVEQENGLALKVETQKSKRIWAVEFAELKLPRGGTRSNGANIEIKDLWAPVKFPKADES